MPIALQVDKVDISRRKRRVFYTPTLSGNYVAGGDTLDFTVATNPNFVIGAMIPSRAPDEIEIEGSFDGMANSPIVGSANNNSKLKLWTTSDTEMAGAYTANQKADAANCRIIATYKIGAS